MHKYRIKNIKFSLTIVNRSRVEYTMTNGLGRLGKVLLVRIVKNGLVRLGYRGSRGQRPPV